VPTGAIVAGVVNENVPPTLATPELNTEALSAWPYVSADAVGTVVIVGVAFPTVTLTVVVTVL
jgi:hypothetical protein